MTQKEDLDKRVRELSEEAGRLVRQLRLDEADAVMREARELFGRIDPPPLDTTYLMLMTRSSLFSARAEWKRAFDQLELAMALAARYPQLPAMPASLLSVRARLLDRLGHHQDAYDAAQGAIDAATPDADETKRRIVAEMLVLQGKALQTRRDYQPAVSAFDSALDRITAGEPEVSWRIEVTWRSMFGRATSLEQLGRGIEALAAYEEFIKRFKDSDDPEIQAAVSPARARRALLAAAPSGS